MHIFISVLKRTELTMEPTVVYRIISYEGEYHMTDNEKKQEEKVFSQEVAENELESAAGGKDCGYSAFSTGPCPKGGIYVQICPNTVNSMEPLEELKPNLVDPVIIEELLKEDK